MSYSACDFTDDVFETLEEVGALDPRKLREDDGALPYNAAKALAAIRMLATAAKAAKGQS